MKKLLLTFSLATSLLFIEGCSTPQRAAYNTSSVVIVSVEQGMGIFNDFVKAGKITIEQEKSVRDAYVKYQASIRVFKQIITASINQPENTSELDRALTVIENSRDSLLELVRSFTKN